MFVILSKMSKVRYKEDIELTERHKQAVSKIIDHIIIIRWSVDLNRNEFVKKIDSLFKEERLKERFELFEKYCFPSLSQQTYCDFKVILVIDSDLPCIWKEKLENLLCNHKNFIIHVWNKEHIFENNAWLRCYTENKKFICTTRMDDDDMIHADANKFFKHCLFNYRKIFEKYKMNFNVSNGIYLHMENHENIYSIKCTNKELAVFMSYITPSEIENNVYSYCHDELKKYDEIKKVQIFYKNAPLFGVSNHAWGNDNRLQRFSNRKEEKITKNEIYNLFALKN